MPNEACSAGVLLPLHDQRRGACVSSDSSAAREALIVRWASLSTAMPKRSSFDKSITLNLRIPSLMYLWLGNKGKWRFPTETQ